MPRQQSLNYNGIRPVMLEQNCPFVANDILKCMFMQDIFFKFLNVPQDFTEKHTNMANVAWFHQVLLDLCEVKDSENWFYSTIILPMYLYLLQVIAIYRGWCVVHYDKWFQQMILLNHISAYVLLMKQVTAIC